MIIIKQCERGRKRKRMKKMATLEDRGRISRSSLFKSGKLPSIVFLYLKKAYIKYIFVKIP